MSADAQFWDDIADDYAQKPVDLPDAFERKIAITVEHLVSTDRVLDIGCGTGSLLLRLAEHAAELHGLDISKEMVRIARDKAAAAHADHVQFHVGAFDESFDVLDDDSLDMVLAYSLLHLVDDHRVALEHIFRLLKPGGIFVSSTVCLKDGAMPMGPVLWVMRKLGKAPYVSRLKRSTLMADMRDVGFVDVEAHDVGAKPTTAFVVCQKPA